MYSLASAALSANALASRGWYTRGVWGKTLPRSLRKLSQRPAAGVWCHYDPQGQESAVILTRITDRIMDRIIDRIVARIIGRKIDRI